MLQKLAKVGSLFGMDLLWQPMSFWKELQNGKASSDVREEKTSDAPAWPADDKYPQTPWR